MISVNSDGLENHPDAIPKFTVKKDNAPKAIEANKNLMGLIHRG
jgi:hypothetical protein